MTNSIEELLTEDKLKQIFPSEKLNKIQFKKVHRFDILPIPDNTGMLAVKLKLSDKSQIEFSISKGLATTLGATLLNRSKLLDGE